MELDLEKLKQVYQDTISNLELFQVNTSSAAKKAIILSIINNHKISLQCLAKINNRGEYHEFKAYPQHGHCTSFIPA